MKRMWILPDIYNSSMTQISLKSAVQNSMVAHYIRQGPGPRQSWGHQRYPWSTGPFRCSQSSPRNHMAAPHDSLDPQHELLSHFEGIPQETSKNGVPGQQMICCKWDQTGNASLTCSKKEKLVLCRRSLVQFSCNAKHLSDSIRWLWEIVVSAIIVIQIPYLFTSILAIHCLQTYSQIWERRVTIQGSNHRKPQKVRPSFEEIPVLLWLIYF